MSRRLTSLLLGAMLLALSAAAPAQDTSARSTPVAVGQATETDDPPPTAGEDGAQGEEVASAGQAPAPTPAGSTAPDADASPSAQEADPAAGEPPPAAGAPTQAEQDFAAIYGDGSYDPVADPTLPAPAELPTSYDPWEPFNRRMHALNNIVDRRIAKPLAQAYIAVVPRPVRLGVGNFFSNLGQPVSAVNALLQGKPKQAGQSLARFAVNTTLGVGGLFDPATKFRIPNRSEDFGQTLGVWGWERSRYLELPLFGPRTVRDVFGLVGDGPLSPIRGIEDDKIRVFTQGLQLVDIRTQLMAVDSMREGATDEYALFRDAWMQRRNYQIFGDRMQQGDASLPDYLHEEQDNPMVPADAMPIVPGSGG